MTAISTPRMRGRAAAPAAAARPGGCGVSVAHAASSAGRVMAAQCRPHDGLLAQIGRRRSPPPSGRHRAPAPGRRDEPVRESRSNGKGSTPPAFGEVAHHDDRVHAWCRRRCRVSDRRAAGCGSRATSHLEIAIFCWLPPEKEPTRVHSARSFDLDTVEDAGARPRSRGCRRSAQRGAKRSITGIEALCLPLSFRNRPSVLRSSGTRPMRDVRRGSHRRAR